MDEVLKAAKAYYETARELCALLSSLNEPALSRQSAKELLLALLSLCEKSVRLPKVEPEAEDIPVKKDWSFAPFGTEHCYWEIFDPETREEPVACSLWDDGEDIGNELMEGCRLFETGRPREALWHWKFSFETHWGHHAFGALRALYAICFWKDGGCF